MSKKVIFVIIAVLIVGLAIGSYFSWSAWKKSKIDKEKLKVDIEQTENDTSIPLSLVPVEVGVDPLENKPDINPISNTNPFSNIKINPFE